MVVVVVVVVVLMDPSPCKVGVRRRFPLPPLTGDTQCFPSPNTEDNRFFSRFRRSNIAFSCDSCSTTLGAAVPGAVPVVPAPVETAIEVVPVVAAVTGVQVLLIVVVRRSS